MQPNDLFEDLPSLVDFSCPSGRTLLYSLTPIGLGTPLQESLLSFLVRVSRAHAINPRRLIGTVLAQSNPAIGQLAYAGFFRKLAKTVNGLGDYAAQFDATLERTTGTAQLRRLCLLPWRDLLPVNGQGTLAGHPQWCPECLMEQWNSVGERYQPLVWAFAAFKVCPSHGRALEERCPHCGKQQSFVPRYPDVGICSECGCFLVTQAIAETELAVPPSSQELWSAKALLSMVERQSTSSCPLPTKDDFRRFVLGAVDRLAGGNRAAFCRKIGLPGRALNGWLTKGEKPSMAQLLLLCYRLNVLPADILPGKEITAETDVSSRRTSQFPRKRCRRPTLVQREGIRVSLESMLAGEDARPISLVASELAVSPRCLRYWFPELCAALTVRARQTQQDRSARHREDQCRKVKATVVALRLTGKYPSRRQVNAVLRKEGMSLAQSHLIKAYREAIAP